MMNKKQTSKRSIFKYTLLIPVIGALVFFNSAFKSQAGTVETVVMAETGKTGVQDPPQIEDKAEIGKMLHTIVRDTPPQTENKARKEIFTHVEEMPTFPGGEQEMMRYLMNNMQYPVIAQEQVIQGRVVVRFVVTEDGSIEDATVMRSLDPSCDREALRVVKKMPDWIPGKQNGIPVSVYYTLPVIFKLVGVDGANNSESSGLEIDEGVVVMTYGGPDDKGTKTAILHIESLPTSQEVVVGDIKGDKTIYTRVEEFPSFPGGEKAMMQWLSDNIQYPALAHKESIQGRVIVRFVVAEDGSIEDAAVMRSLHPVCDEAALRVVKMMPKWIPGKQDGKPVSVYYTLPIVFKLDGNADSKKEETTLLIPDNTTFIVDGKEISRSEMVKIDPVTIESVDVHRSEDGKGDTVRITLKKAEITE